MTKYDAGDIVLVREPFTDLTSSKRRPAVILSPQAYSVRFGDLVVMPLTSQIEHEASLELSQWQKSGLLKPTWVKPIIGTLSMRMIEKPLGKLADADERCIRAALRILLADCWIA